MTGKALIAIGALLMGVGLILVYAPGLLSWFGRLPGDVRIERDGFTFFFPVTSLLVVSIVLSVLVGLLFRR